VPEPVARVADLMSTFRAPWVLCGGWSVDAWLGRQTREHGDIDVSVFEDDQRAVYDHLAGWHMNADDVQSEGKPWGGRPLTLPAHIHCAAPDSGFIETDLAQGVSNARDGFNLEIMFNERAGDDWVLSAEHGLVMPVSRCIQRSAWDLPAVVPELLLFYKGTAYVGTKNHLRPRDEADFVALLPLLTGKQRGWLREAISKVYVGEHPWLPQLSVSV
jgi:hypothetical protein